MEMGATTQLQALRLAENLTLPSVQVIVMRANMSCSHCRGRVSRIISRINGLVDYVVDVKKKQVTVRSIRTDYNTREPCKLLEQNDIGSKQWSKKGCFPILFRN